MNNKLLLSASMICILMLAAASASAITFRTERYSLSGTGSFMASPPMLCGDITGGTMYPGTFRIAFDDTGWPADNGATPENERLDYVIAHYFDYDATPGAECWDGYFPPSGSSEPKPRWRFYTAAGDTVGGDCTQITITIHDLNANGIMEESEYAQKVISGNLVAYINYGGGCFQNFCGTGSFSGTLNVLNAQTMEEELYVPSPALPAGRLYLKDDGCSVGVESSTWGTIKAIYR